MTELRSETQALLDLGRAGDDPSDAAIARNRRQLELKVGGAALGTAAVTGSATKALAASGRLKMLAICGAVAVASVGLGGYALERSSAEPSSKPAALTTPCAPENATQRGQATQTPPPEAVVAEAEATPPELEATSVAPSPRSAGAAKSAAPASIQSEIELIRGAQKQLHRGEARAALALLAEHARRFPGGVLAQERDASLVSALCQTGDVAGARAQAERFLQRSPQSPFAERVKKSCAKVQP